jgi:hypothetical protein
MIGVICKTQLVGWAMLPLRMVAYRLVASHNLAGRVNRLSSGRSLYPVMHPLAELHDLDLRRISTLVSRVALCGAIEVAINLGLWGCQWATVTYLGKKYFAWGTL